MDQVLKIAEMLHSRVRSLELKSTLGRQQITCFIGKRLEPVVVDNTHYSRIGFGDDGVIIKANNDMHPNGDLVVYKIFMCAPPGHLYYEAKNRTVRDQALREFNALKMINGHPNFLNVYSDEIDTCEMNYDGYLYEECCALKLNYVSGLTNIRHSFVLLGVQYNDAAKEYSMNYDHRNILVKHVLAQAFSMLDKLNSLGIRHRDVDNCNFMIKMPDLHLYLFDFSRAYLPHVPGLTDTVDPEEICLNLREKLRELISVSPEKDGPERIQRGIDLKAVRYQLDQYNSPVEDYKGEITDASAITDKVMMKYWINVAIKKQTEDVDWILHGATEETRADILQQSREENDIIVKFVSECWSEGTLQNAEIKAGAFASPVDALGDFAATFNFIGAKKYDSAERGKFIRAQMKKYRRLNHSVEYNTANEKSTSPRKK